MSSVMVKKLVEEALHKQTKELHEDGIDTIVNIIGFDVNEKEAKSLKSVAKAGGGQYQTVANAEELNHILQNEASAFGQ
nr:hypothetical protein [Bacillus pumilus]